MINAISDWVFHYFKPITFLTPFWINDIIQCLRFWPSFTQVMFCCVIPNLYVNQGELLINLLSWQMFTRCRVTGIKLVIPFNKKIWLQQAICEMFTVLITSPWVNSHPSNEKLGEPSIDKAKWLVNTSWPGIVYVCFSELDHQQHR